MSDTAFDELLLGGVPAGRQALRKLVPGRIKLRPVVESEARGQR